MTFGKSVQPGFATFEWSKVHLFDDVIIYYNTMMAKMT